MENFLPQVEALQAQLEEQTKLAKEQVDGLLEDRRVKVEEYEARRQRDADKVQTITEKLVNLITVHIVLAQMSRICLSPLKLKLYCPLHFDILYTQEDLNLFSGLSHVFMKCLQPGC